MSRSAKILAGVSLVTVFLLVGFIALAAEKTYTLEYVNPHVKGPALSNANIRGQIFRDGTPAGYFNSHTNSNGTFSVHNAYDSNIHIEIIEIAGEENLNMKCHGKSMSNNSKIIIQCSSIESQNNKK